MLGSNTGRTKRGAAMPRRLSVTDARAKFSDVLGMVADEKETIIIENRGRPVAVLISPERWKRYQLWVKDQFFRAIDRLQERNRDMDPEEVERDVTETVEEVRRQRYEKRKTGRDA
jgi:prevent-host-death family protein